MFCNFCGKVVFTLRWVYGKQDDNVRCTSVLQRCSAADCCSHGTNTHTHQAQTFSSVTSVALYELSSSHGSHMANNLT